MSFEFRDIRSYENSNGQTINRKEVTFHQTRHQLYSLNQATDQLRTLQNLLKNQYPHASMHITLITERQPIHFRPIAVNSPPLNLPAMEISESGTVGYMDPVFHYPSQHEIEYIIVRIEIIQN
jgi:hypothetical protein